jgi:hypothetical protein
MTALALAEPISPELVLVSPPEEARRARSMLVTPVWAPPRAWPPAQLDREVGYVELAAVWLVCVAMAAGPLLFLLVAAH